MTGSNFGAFYSICAEREFSHSRVPLSLTFFSSTRRSKRFSNSALQTSLWTDAIAIRNAWLFPRSRKPSWTLLLTNPPPRRRVCSPPSTLKHLPPPTPFPLLPGAFNRESQPGAPDGAVGERSLTWETSRVKVLALGSSYRGSEARTMSWGLAAPSRRTYPRGWRLRSES